MSSGELNVIIHATEDMNKILGSIRKTLSIDIDKLKIKRSDLSGHFGNPLIYINIRLDKESAVKIFETILSKLPREDISTIINNLDEFIHSNKLYLRFNKQELCRGRLALGESDSVRLVIKNMSKKSFLRKVGNVSKQF